MAANRIKGITIELLTIRQAAEKWNLGTGRIQYMCETGRIKGIIKFGNAWVIPADIMKATPNRSVSKKR